MITILSIILGGLLGGIGVYLFLKPLLKSTQEINGSIQQRNEELKQQCEAMEKKYVTLSSNITELSAKQYEISNNIEFMTKQAQETEKTLLESAKRTAEANFELSMISMASDYDNAAKACEEAYLKLIQDCKDDTLNTINELNNKINIAELEFQKQQEQLIQQKNITAAAIDANKRALEELDKKNYYKIQINDIDLNDINKLRSIAPGLRNREPLDKVIWKTYYEKPTAALLGRVIGANIKTGIYKITNLDNGMCYVGQSVNLADRWKAHIKAGLGIDSSNNKLYTAMKNDGVENFTFEIIEECDRSRLNEQEKFWINYFQSETFGYNSTKGNG